jgi:Sap, sulfolipid-1-addressing protein
VSFATLLPMSFVMIAGPQILSAVFLATSEKWKLNSAAFLLGAALSITIIVTAAFLLGIGVSNSGASDDALYVVVLVLLLAAMVHAYVKRHETQPPKWMGRLQTASPKLAFTLGFLLLGVFPTDILTSVAVGSYLAAHSDAWRDMLPFVGLTLLLLGIPALLLLFGGERSEAFLPKVRTWMTTNAWIINEIVLAFFVVIVISNLAG